MIQSFMTKLSPQEKKILYITIVVVLLALLDRLFFSPVVSQLESIDEEVEQNKQIIKRDLRFLRYKERILKEDRAFSKYYGNKFETEEEIIAAFLKKIEVLATESGVNLIKVNPSDSVVQDGYIEYSASLECNGTLEDIATFMHAIDTSDEMLRIVKFSMNPKRGSEQEVQSAMKVVKMIIDYLPEEEAKGSLTDEGALGGSFDVPVEGDAVGGGERGQGRDSGGLKGGSPKDEKPEAFQEIDAEKVIKSKQVSERYQIKGKKSAEVKSKPDKKKKDLQVEEIKPSVWERFMSSRKKEGEKE